MGAQESVKAKIEREKELMNYYKSKKEEASNKNNKILENKKFDNNKKGEVQHIYGNNKNDSGEAFKIKQTNYLAINPINKKYQQNSYNYFQKNYNYNSNTNNIQYNNQGNMNILYNNEILKDKEKDIDKGTYINNNFYGGNNNNVNNYYYQNDYNYNMNNIQYNNQGNMNYNILYNDQLLKDREENINNATYINNTVYELQNNINNDYNNSNINNIQYKNQENLNYNILYNDQLLKDKEANDNNYTYNNNSIYEVQNNNINNDYYQNNYNYNINNNQYKTKKKLNLNILYYDELLRDKGENSDNCTFLEMNTNGTFYGCHNLYLFDIVCSKIRKYNKIFILISSGSAAEKIYNKCLYMEQIRECYIYCFEKERYIYLMNKYNKLKGVYNDFNQLEEKLFSIREIKNDVIKSSSLIFFDDYQRIYIKLHYEIIRKYSLYQTLKKCNYNESEFLALIQEKYPYFLELSKQLFPNRKEIIDFFKKNTNESEYTLLTIFNCNDDIKSYVHNYTAESFYYRYLNKFLRDGDFESFRILSSHLSKFIFSLYDYRNKNISLHENSNLYRKLYLSKDAINLYKISIGKIICYPAFTSTSIIKDGFMPAPIPNCELVQLIIEQNNSKSVVSISEFSQYPEEKEYLFLPFSFFKIVNIRFGNGTENNPHIINLLALYSDKPIEELFLDFMEEKTDNLEPEGLDMLILYNGNKAIKFNPIYYSKNY